MNGDKQNAATHWIEDYRENRSLLDNTDVGTLLSQLKRARKDSPELYSAFKMLTLAVYDDIQQLGQTNSEEEDQSVLAVIHPLVVNAVLADRVSPNVGEWKRRYCRWATKVWWDKFINGNLVEPPAC